jgi:hypothetical protein
MKTNVSIELSDSERSYIANKIDNKTTKRLATRAEINALVKYLVAAVISGEGAKPRAAGWPAPVDIPDIDRGAWSFIGMEIAPR